MIAVSKCSDSKLKERAGGETEQQKKETKNQI